jgi:prepilin-type N-terminal cleavage/methylation domain-containing protein
MNPHSQQQVSNPSSQAGFTIVESLLAIILVSILLAAIAPVLVLATANRVQAKRVELATNAAKAYVDGVRAGTIDVSDVLNSNRELAEIGPPNSAGRLTCQANKDCDVPAPRPNYKLFCVDGEGDGACTNNSLKDMLVQVSAYQQTSTTSTSTNPNSGFQLGIRVYRADAFQDSAPLKSSVNNARNNRRAQATTFTGGLGDRKAPQIEMQTEIVTDSTKYTDYCGRIGGCS